MTENDFLHIRILPEEIYFFRPTYDEYINKEFRLLRLDKQQGLIQLDEEKFNQPTRWYRYENLEFVRKENINDRNTEFTKLTS